MTAQGVGAGRAVASHEARTRRTRARILTTAGLAFAAEGYQGASINVIIETAQVTKGVFYLLFDSKPQLASAVVQEMHAAWGPAVAAWAERDVDALQVVQGLVAEMAGLSVGHPLVRGGLRLADDGMLAPGVGPPFEEWERILGHAFHRARREGILCGGVEPALAAHLVTVMLAGELRLAASIEPVVAVQQRIGASLHVLLVGLATPGWLQRRRVAVAGVG